VKTKVVGNNLNPDGNEPFDLDVGKKETQAFVLEVEVFDKDDVGQEKKLGVVKCPFADLEPEKLKDLPLSPLDTLKVKTKRTG
jgi:Ca2+-dependent lipid-binding protein